MQPKQLGLPPEGGSQKITGHKITGQKITRHKIMGGTHRSGPRA